MPNPTAATGVGLMLHPQPQRLHHRAHGAVLDWPGGETAPCRRPGRGRAARRQPVRVAGGHAARPAVDDCNYENSASEGAINLDILDYSLGGSEATLAVCIGLIDLVSLRPDTELFGSDARRLSSACADVLLGGACQVMICAPTVLGRSSLVRVRYRSPTSGWRRWVIPLVYPTSATYRPSAVVSVAVFARERFQRSDLPLSPWSAEQTPSLQFALRFKVLAAECHTPHGGGACTPAYGRASVRASPGRGAAARQARRARGQHIGRPKVLDDQNAKLGRGMHENGESASTIATALGISRATVYRVLADDSGN
jgi:Helix-turn-helix domain of resolvase